MVSGAVGVGDELLLGPLEGGAFRRVRISSIHRSKVDVLSVRQGQHATLAVQPLEEAGGGGGSGAAAPDAPAPVEQQQGMQPPPSRADSAGCLAAWMQHTCSGQAALLQPSPFDSGREALPGSIQPPRPPSTPALTIAGAGLAGSRSTAQLSSSLQLPGSAELQHGWGSSPQLTPAGSGAAPRPRKAS